jgi:hypothetical protein
VAVLLALMSLAAPPPVLAQDHVQVDGTVHYLSGSTLILVLDGPPGPVSYVIVGQFLLPIQGPRPTVNVDLGQVPQSEYMFMRPGERITVIGTVSPDRRRLLGTSIIRGPGSQAP